MVDSETFTVFFLCFFFGGEVWGGDFEDLLMN